MFEWQIEEESGSKPPPEKYDHNGRSWGKWVVLALLLLLGAAGWSVSQNQVSQREADIVEQVQDTLDFQRDAYLRGDGELLFSSQTASPAWISAQLQPGNHTFYDGNPTATKAEQYNNDVWVNVQWQENEILYQRILFFRLENGGLRQAATMPSYWGVPKVHDTAFGQVIMYEVDELWLEEITTFTQDLVQKLCPDSCDGRSQNLSLVLSDGYEVTAVPDEIIMPSPRLMALTADGDPAQRFWDLLEARIREQLAPAVILFGVPPQALQLVDYETAALQFMEQHSNIKIKFVLLDSNTITPGQLAVIDGAAITPSAELLASGAIFDLTDFVVTDPDFDSHDFYEQIWQGAYWKNRIWFLPQAGAMRILFYDKFAYGEAQIKEPSLRWTWEELAHDMTAVSDPDSPQLYKWGFMDVSNDVLFSYAYNWKNDCTEEATVRCERPLTDSAVAATLYWYSEMAGQPGQMPNLLAAGTDFKLDDLWSRNYVLDNWQSARRRAVVWVDEPTDFEFRYLLNPLGVVPFPGSDRFDGITPLHVQGHVISQSSERPLAMWQWLKFLSYQPLRPKTRFVPARPSVAESSRYWQILPRELGNAMRTAFPFARPIMMDEAHYFSEEQLEAVLSGRVSPETAVHINSRLSWFGN